MSISVEQRSRFIGIEKKINNKGILYDEMVWVLSFDEIQSVLCPMLRNGHSPLFRMPKFSGSIPCVSQIATVYNMCIISCVSVLLLHVSIYGQTLNHQIKRL